jgi:Fur family peroxide stress response transcriptional regulator
MRYSKQREIILTALRSNPVHPTADYLYNLLKPANPALSLGTVYRNLNLLAKDGKIKKIKGLDNKEHFDHNNFDHCHVICGACGAVRDIMPSKKLEAALKELKDYSSFKINSCEIIMHGKCKNCI